MKKLRLGVVGLGGRGRTMFRLAAQHFPQVIPAAACDIDEAHWFGPHDFPAVEPTPMAQLFPETRFYADYDTMLAEASLDAVLVETPAHNHAEFCARALARGIAVLSDIPSVHSVEEAIMLWEAAQKSRALFMTGANPNEWGFVEALVDFHRQGLLGDPYYLEAEYIHDLRSYFDRTPWRRTFVPILYCTHSLGPLLRILPEELRRVSCVSTGSHILKEPNQHDLMTAHFTTEHQVICRLTTSFINEAGIGEHTYRIFGTQGYFERFSGRGDMPPATLCRSSKLYGLNRITRLPVDTMRQEPELQQCADHGGADFALLHHFFAAWEGKCEPITLRDGLRMTLPGIFAARSAELGGAPVEIRYPWD